MSSPPNLKNSRRGLGELLSVVQSFLIFFIWIGISYGISGAIFYYANSFSHKFIIDLGVETVTLLLF